MARKASLTIEATVDQREPAPHHRPKIKPALRAKLVSEANHKCANPGCANWRTHIHHIQEWAVYKSHKDEHMIAVCPSCHDAIHHGSLRISDEMLYAWKRIRRNSDERSARLHVDPGLPIKLRAGRVTISSTRSEVTAFKFANGAELRFRLLDGDLLLLSTSLRDAKGRELVRIAENYVRVPPRADVEFEHVPGQIHLRVPNTRDFVPDWLALQAASSAPWILEPTVTALQLTVVEPGVVRLQGFWASFDVAIVFVEDGILFCRPSYGRWPRGIICTEQEATLLYEADGPLFRAIERVAG